MGKVRQKKNKVVNPRIILAFILGTLIFLIGVLISQVLGYYSLDKIKLELEETYNEQLGWLLSSNILKDYACNIDNLELSKKRIELGQELYTLESIFGKQDPKVLAKKEYFQILEVQEYLLMKEIKERCNKSYILILYFYSNKGDCDECIAQGMILDDLWKSNKNVSIFSFDYNIENPATEALKKLYGVKGYPALVINGKTFNRFLSKEELKRVIENLS